ncbi:MAG: energy transducer TonB [Maribacter sp.]|nr:energy transducer TonB [Maribacter sp.]
MLTKQKSKAVYQFKYLLLMPLVFGMLVYTSCDGEVPNNDQETEMQSLEDAQLITKIKEELEDSSIDFEFPLPINNEGVLLSKEDFFRHHLTMHALIAKMNEEFKDDAFFVEFASQEHMPSSQKYEAYVKGFQALQIIDENLKNSIKGYGGSVRLIENDDEVSLSTSNILEVDNLKALSKDELIEFNALIKKASDEQPSDHGILVSDNTHVILVRSKKEIVEPVLIKVNDVEDKQQGLKSNQEPIIINTGEPTYDDAVPFAIIDEVPIYPGCETVSDKKACFLESIQNHIKKHFNYPKEAEELGLEGRVNVIFYIETDGQIGGLKMRGPSPILEAEVERIIRRLPEIRPGKHNGKVVQVPFSIPITFKLDKGKNYGLINEAIFKDKSEDIKQNIKAYNELLSIRNGLLAKGDVEASRLASNEEQLILLKIKIQEELAIKIN